ncbi:MAG: hypothetical protein MUF04_08060 [Akkermansiaceae bacterium]|nr:hypothetical protein [Akkermansiaceae bacterium]
MRADDAAARDLAAAICHRETWLRVTAEREFLRLLDAGCHTPVGVFSALDGDQLTLSARVFPEQGGRPRAATASGPAGDPLALALALYQSLP